MHLNILRMDILWIYGISSFCIPGLTIHSRTVITNICAEECPTTYSRLKCLSSLLSLVLLASYKDLGTLLIPWRYRRVARAHRPVHLNSDVAILHNVVTEGLASMKLLVVRSVRHPHTECSI